MSDLQQQIIAAIRAGKTNRQDLMTIDNLRLMTWARIAEQLKALCRDGVLIESKAGWRLAKG